MSYFLKKLYLCIRGQGNETRKSGSTTRVDKVSELATLNED